MPQCKRCGSNDVVEHKGQLRCSVCDTVIPVRQPENFTYDKASGGFVVDNPTKRESASAKPPKLPDDDWRKNNLRGPLEETNQLLRSINQKLWVWMLLTFLGCLGLLIANK